MKQINPNLLPSVCPQIVSDPGWSYIVIICKWYLRYFWGRLQPIIRTFWGNQFQWLKFKSREALKYNQFLFYPKITYLALNIQNTPNDKYASNLLPMINQYNMETMTGDMWVNTGIGPLLKGQTLKQLILKLQNHLFHFIWFSQSNFPCFVGFQNSNYLSIHLPPQRANIEGGGWRKRIIITDIHLYYVQIPSPS